MLTAWMDPAAQDDLKKTLCFVNCGGRGAGGEFLPSLLPVFTAPHLAPSLPPSLLLSPLLIGFLTAPSPWQLEAVSVPAPHLAEPSG